MTLFGKVLTFWEIHVILTPVIALQKPARPATGGAPAGAPLFHYQDLNTRNQKELQQYLSVLTSFRNFCAHGERLFSRKVKENIPDTELHRKLRIPKTGENYKYGKGDLFSVVIAFRYLIPSEDFLKFKETLVNLINSFLKKTTHVTEDELLRRMGFPVNWKYITRYKK